MRLNGFLTVAFAFLLIAYSSNKLLAAEPGERIGDWFYNCGADVKSNKGSCYISQTVEGAKGKRALRLLVTNVGYFFDDSKLWLVAFLPLESWKIAVQKEIVIDVDKKPLLTGKVDVCLPVGCRVGFLINGNPSMVLKNGRVAGLTFVTLNGKKARIEISLKGFTKALKVF